ncbi:MAG TPA: hypothetical protein VFU37_12035 [Pyrinomonadaceae bacterium]|nr:hypothetical protein [Pyrinomonadaceae bacterium]
MMNSNEDAKLETGNCPFGHRRRFWKFPLIVATVILIKAGIVLFLWNALIPDLFHGPVLTYLQALGLTVLAKLLFGFHGFRPFGGPPWKARWPGLSPEEREKLREDIRRKFGEKTST